MNKEKLVLIIIILFALLFIIWYSYMYITVGVSENICKDKCYQYGALTYELIHSGNWDTPDTCVCYFDDHIKSFKVGE